jgi:hypothetical protein
MIPKFAKSVSLPLLSRAVTLLLFATSLVQPSTPTALPQLYLLTTQAFELTFDFPPPT